MSDPNIEILRRRLADSEKAGAAEIDSAFARLEEKILLLVDTIESAHSVRLEELRQEAARLAAARASGTDY
jgi:di/tripeptidase